MAARFLPLVRRGLAGVLNQSPAPASTRGDSPKLFFALAPSFGSAWINLVDIGDDSRGCVFYLERPVVGGSNPGLLLPLQSNFVYTASSPFSLVFGGMRRLKYGNKGFPLFWE